jgi:hypothetical protein
MNSLVYMGRRGVEGVYESRGRGVIRGKGVVQAGTEVVQGGWGGTESRGVLRKMLSTIA